MKKKYVQKQEEKTIKKKKKFVQKIKNNISEQYKFEVDMEEAYRKKKEEEIFEMEKLELELIKKLHNTQLLQKSAFEELESVLNMKAN